MSRNFLNLSDISNLEILSIIEKSIDLKSTNQSLNLMQNKYLALIFEKSSTRTRVSFEVAMNQLGGRASFLSLEDLQISRGESIEETAKVISSYADFIVLRTLDHITQTKFAENSSCPVINGLSNLSHPCQILADLLTLTEEGLNLKNMKVCWAGDPNNVCFSYIEAAKVLGFNLHVACPVKYHAQDLISKNVSFSESLQESVNGADVIATDVWVSMGDEKDRVEREKDFSQYQINPEVLRLASKNCYFLHCLPANKGQEISKDMLNHPQSLVWKQAANRLHVQKGLLAFLSEST